MLRSVRRVVDATMIEDPRDTEEPLMVIEEFESLLLSMEPASIVLVTVPVSVVYTPFVTVPALPLIDPVIVLEKVLFPEKVLLFARSVEEAALIVMLSPLAKVVPLMVPSEPERRLVPIVVVEMS